MPLAEGDKWVVISQDPLYKNGFENYLEDYGSDWVTYEMDSLNQINVKLKTYEEYRGRFEEEGKFLIIQSEEVSDYFDSKPLHMNVTNIQKKIDPQGGNSVVEVLQNYIDAAIKQRDELNTPMIPHILKKISLLCMGLLRMTPIIIMYKEVSGVMQAGAGSWCLPIR